MRVQFTYFTTVSLAALTLNCSPSNQDSNAGTDPSASASNVADTPSADAATTAEPEPSNSTATQATQNPQSTETPLSTLNPQPTQAPQNSSTAPSVTVPTPSASSSEQPSTWGDILPGTPVPLASGLAYPGRIALSNGHLLFPNRVGFPLESGNEQLLRIPTTGGSPQQLATVGALWGFAAADNSVLIADFVNAAVVRVDEQDGTALGIVAGLTGQPLQVAANSTALFVSLYDEPRMDIVAIKPSGELIGVIWSEVESGYPLWLKATSDTLYFETNGQEGTYQIHQLVLATGVDTVLFEQAGELGAFDVRGDSVWFASPYEGRIGHINLADLSVSTFADVTDPWSILVDQAFLYAGLRPGYCPSGTEGSLVRIPLAGGPTETLVSGLACPSQMVSDEDGIYWVNNGTWSGSNTELAPADGSLLFLPRDR